MIPRMTCNASLALIIVSSLAGCEDDERHKQVAIVATQAAERQAQQNTEMARVNREIAEGTRRMVEADAEARKEIVSVHHELQAERAVLADGFDDLESERKEIAGERRTESMLVPAAQIVVGAGLVIAVLVFCISLIHGRNHSDAIEAELNDLLIQELANDQPQLLSQRTALNDDSSSDDAEPPQLTSNS